MTLAVIFTIVFLPIYLGLRSPFQRLPLHMDTGFYVSNHTIATGRWDFRKGWNAHFAGCSKLLPELIYSWVYLASRPADNFDSGESSRRRRPAYIRNSRLAASCHNYLTAVAVGLLSAILHEGDLRYYYAGLVTFALLSSEPHWGVYFECAELFELLPQVLGILCFNLGVAQASWSWLFAGAFLWAAEVYFVKLSSAPAALVLFAGLALIQAWTVPHLCAGATFASLLYVLWLLRSRRTPSALLKSLRGHERVFDHGLGWAMLSHRLVEKGRALAAVVLRQPLFPTLAVLGLISGHAPSVLVWLWLGGAVLSWVIQAADCRYYMILMLPPISLFAASGAVFLWGLGSVGWAFLIAAALAWLVHNSLRPWRMDPSGLNEWCWRGSRPAEEVHHNLELEHAAANIRALAAGRSLLVYGPRNQAYVLLGSAYPTPIVAPESYLDLVCPGWQTSLNEDLTVNPPHWVLDTGDCFDAAETREKLNLDYRLRRQFGSILRLFERVGPPGDLAPAPGAGDGTGAGYARSAVTYRPQTRSQLEAEARIAGLPLAEAVLNPQSKVLAELLNRLHSRGLSRLALYGAGRFTTRHADVYRNSPAPVVLVLDDNACQFRGSFLDWPIRALHDVGPAEFDAVILSTDRFSGPMRARIRRHFGRSVPVYFATEALLDAPAAPF